jgi:GTP 3',8-cyclase
MKQFITIPSLRVKITGICNRSCNFCNEEGDMRTIKSVEPNKKFFECINTLAKILAIKRVMITGGEPTMHSGLQKIVNGISSLNISITTNGIRPLSVNKWIALRKAGLQKVIVSIHDAMPQSFIQLEVRQRKFSWALRAIESQKQNLVSASEAGLRVRVNIVAYDSQKQVEQVLYMLEGLQQKYKFEIRLLNDLANIEKSQQIIHDVCATLEAKPIREERRAGSSNVVLLWETELGFRFSTKMAYRYFFDPICAKCLIKEQCHEGFYGIRVERRVSGYWVRLCIYKHTPDVLMPWELFLQSDLIKKIKVLCEKEQL